MVQNVYLFDCLVQIWFKEIMAKHRVNINASDDGHWFYFKEPIQEDIADLVL